MPSQAEKAVAFRDLHAGERAFIMPNPFDVGTARLLAAEGFKALATSSAALAFMLGKADQAAAMTRREGIEHLRTIVEATELPVNGDLENGYGDAPDEVAQTVREAIAAGAAGCSIEDATGRKDQPLYGVEEAAARIAAAKAAAAENAFVVTARAECFLVGTPDPLEESIRRLKAYETAGADVLYAPGLATAEQVRAVVAVKKPVNVLAGFGTPALSAVELSALGVKRISLGSWPHRAAMGAFLIAAREMRELGTFTFTAAAPRSGDLAPAARAPGG